MKLLRYVMKKYIFSKKYRNILLMNENKNDIIVKLIKISKYTLLVFLSIYIYYLCIYQLNAIKWYTLFLGLSRYTSMSNKKKLFLNNMHNKNIIRYTIFT